MQAGIKLAAGVLVAFLAGTGCNTCKDCGKSSDVPPRSSSPYTPMNGQPVPQSMPGGPGATSPMGGAMGSTRYPSNVGPYPGSQAPNGFGGPAGPTAGAPTGAYNGYPN